MRALALCFLISLMFSSLAAAKITGMPIVGVVLQPSSGSTSNIVPLGPQSHTYVPESYVQQIQNAGGLAVLIPFDLNLAVLDKLLQATDMLFIPGGPADLVNSNGEATKYQDRVHHMIRKGIQRNQNGEYYPILATCLGFENVVISFANQNISILQSGFNDLYFNRSIQVDEAAYQKTRLFKELNKEDLDYVFNEGFLFFYHNFGIQTGFFKKNKEMQEAFHLVGTTNKEKLKDSFVSCIEHKEYPVMANQWHPEKNANEKGYKYKFLDKSKRTIKFLNTFTKKLVDSIRHKAKPLKELPTIIESFVSWSFDPIQTNYTGNNRIFLVPRVLEDHEL